MKKAVLILLAVLALLVGCSGGKPESRYYAIDHFCIEEEGDAFRESAESLTVAVFEWYKSIEGSDGVYLMHCDHYTEDVLEEWRFYGVYENVPNSGFHYYVASPNYLAERGMPLSREEEELIRRGVRCYLLPDTMSEEDAAQMRAYLMEDALWGLDGETRIETAFQSNREIFFGTYSPNVTLEIPGGGVTADPVLYVASTENMKFFESESLLATGVTDGYIRLTEEAYRLYAGKNLPEEMQEKQVTFLNESRIKN